MTFNLALLADFYDRMRETIDLEWMYHNEELREDGTKITASEVITAYEEAISQLKSITNIDVDCVLYCVLEFVSYPDSNRLVKGQYKLFSIGFDVLSKAYKKPSFITYNKLFSREENDILYQYMKQFYDPDTSRFSEANWCIKTFENVNV